MYSTLKRIKDRYRKFRICSSHMIGLLVCVEPLLDSGMHRIHDILVWFRILISGSMPLTNWSGSGFWSESCYFHHWPSRRQQITNLKKSFSASYFLKAPLHHFSKIKGQKKSQNSRNQGFSYYFQSGSGFGPGSATLVYTEYSVHCAPYCLSHIHSDTPTLTPQ